MKTSSKILLGGALGVLILILTMAFYVRSVLGGNTDMILTSGRIEGNGITAEEIRDVDPFEKIEVSNGIHLHLHQEDTFEIKVVTDENVLQYIITEVNGDKLRVYTRKKLRRVKNLDVYVTMPVLKKLAISSGATASNSMPVTGDFINIDGSSGARSNLDIKYDEVDINVSSGAHLEIRGTALKGSLNGSSGAHLNAGQLDVENTSAGVSSGGHVNIGIVKVLSVNASSGGHVNYRGNPEMKNINLSSGGQMNQR
ncbi:MAG: hypothetical protein GVY19_07710 [Bacteroidetes bacterium]|jgi:hypothetical protein|nr:hypothetical protein [Bacteroidota bacterium]